MTSAGGSAVVITINGNAQPLIQALQAATKSLNDFQDTGKSTNTAMGNMGGAVQGLASAFGGLMGNVAGFINQALTMATGIGLYNFFDSLIMKAKQFGDEMFNLEVTTQRAQYGWGYMFSAGGTGTPTENYAQGKQRAADLMAWSKKFSYSVPFTRQDLIQSITTLGGAGATEDQIKQYMPMIADLAATQGAARGLDLSATARAVQGAMFGITRQLRYDLMINPDDLVALGYDSSNPQSLLPALYKWTQKHGEIGAAKGASTQTWYGAYSSFQDRIQNFQLDAGAEAFQKLQDTLNKFTDWWDAHQDQINNFATVVGDTLAAGLLNLADAAGQFAAGWQGSGMWGIWTSLGSVSSSGLKDIANFFQGMSSGVGSSGVFLEFAVAAHDIAEVFKNPQVGKTLNILGQVAGMAGGTMIRELSVLFRNMVDGFANSDAFQTIANAAQDMMNAFADPTASATVKRLTTMTDAGVWREVAYSVRDIGSALGNPQVGATMAALGTAIGQFAGATVTGAVNLFTAIGTVATNPNVDTMVGSLGTLVRSIIGANWTGITLAFGAIGAVAKTQGAKDVFQALAELVKTLVVPIATGWTDTFNAIQKMMKDPNTAMVMAVGMSYLSMAMKMVAVELNNVSAAWQQLLNTLPPKVRQELLDFLSKFGGLLLLLPLGTIAGALIMLGMALELVAGWWTMLANGIKAAETELKKWWDQVQQVMADWKKFDSKGWGAQFIQNFINGMIDQVPGLKLALDNVATLFQIFHHKSPPPFGPLSDDDTWMPNMMKMFTKGITDGTPGLANASSRAAGMVGGAFGSGGGTAYGASGSVYGAGGPNTSYGDASLNITINAATQTYIQNLIEAALNAQGTQQALVQRRPGTLRLGLL